MARITVRRNGPYRVHGPVLLTDHDGNVIETGEMFVLCRCGQSRTKPFCDGTHKTVGFIDPVPPAFPPAPSPPPAGP
ncbi:MAG TPA: CDGSH iron-sulfur domain-containing protein, partial [Gemmatimonadales bacterium]|nr:CDGSH iron-sulfur domain-containing protein [Gemmatimonadales bacterium]